LVTSSGSDTLSLIEGSSLDSNGPLSNAKIVNMVKVGIEPSGVVYNPKNNSIYVANSGSNDVSVIDSGTNRISTVEVGIEPSGIAYNPADHNIYVANSGSKQYLF
jgi:YVTN family beta-propeller protein